MACVSLSCFSFFQLAFLASDGMITSAWLASACCDVLKFFGFLYCCCKYVTSMIICASGFYTVVCDHSSKTPGWSCLLHLFYNKDKNSLPALQVQTPTSPPPSVPSQVRCRNFRFQTDAINKSKVFQYLSQFTRLKKEKEKQKRKAVQCRKPESQRFFY